MLDLTTSDCGKTSCKELELEIHFGSLKPPDNNFMMLMTVPFAKSIFLHVSK